MLLGWDCLCTDDAWARFRQEKCSSTQLLSLLGLSWLKQELLSASKKLARNWMAPYSVQEARHKLFTWIPHKKAGIGARTPAHRSAHSLLFPLTQQCFDSLEGWQINQLCAQTLQIKTRAPLLITQCKTPPSVFTINTPLSPGENHFPFQSCFFLPAFPAAAVISSSKRS